MKLTEELKSCDEVYHTTLDPRGPGVLRIHLVPPKEKKPGIPWVAILNGYYLLPMQTSWALLLKWFIEEVNRTNGDPFESKDALIKATVKRAHEVFFNTEQKILRDDLKDILGVLESVAHGNEPDESIGFASLAEYGKHMAAPHRLDLMISAMTREGCWACNQKCLHCYAKGEKMAEVKELSAEEWKKIIDRAKEARIPALTFTGGEPTTRPDLPELVEHASWFVTRLNTNGILLTEELCKKLYDASLDAVQITVYSTDPEIHNTLVGGDHFPATEKGIRNALAAGLNVSVNTPLCSLNRNYAETVRALHEMGVSYFSCSGLIPTGGARSDESAVTTLTKEEITAALREAYDYARKNDCEIAFTSPGWIDKTELIKMKMITPSCGACLSNMAVAPNGDVLPCQSWLFEDGLGNLLKTPFSKIWASRACKKQRAYAMKNAEVCPLHEKRKENEK